MPDLGKYFDIDGLYCGPEGPGEYDHCLVCGCTDTDCSQCVEKTGEPCVWVAKGLCSACATDVFWAGVTGYEHGLTIDVNPYKRFREEAGDVEEPTEWEIDWENGWDYARQIAHSHETPAT